MDEEQRLEQLNRGYSQTPKDLTLGEHLDERIKAAREQLEHLEGVKKNLAAFLHLKQSDLRALISKGW